MLQKSCTPLSRVAWPSGRGHLAQGSTTPCLATACTRSAVHWLAGPALGLAVTWPRLAVPCGCCCGATLAVLALHRSRAALAVVAAPPRESAVADASLPSYAAPSHVAMLLSSHLRARGLAPSFLRCWCRLLINYGAAAALAAL
jgi:hypothetical protein